MHDTAAAIPQLLSPSLAFRHTQKHTNRQKQHTSMHMHAHTCQAWIKEGLKCVRKGNQGERHESLFPSEDCCTYRHMLSHKHTHELTRKTYRHKTQLIVTFFCITTQPETHQFAPKEITMLRFFVLFATFVCLCVCVSLAHTQSCSYNDP